MNIDGGNLKRNERLLSLGGGALLAALATRGSSTTARLLLGLGATGLVARSLAGHCAMKAAVTGQSTFKEGLAEQWRHMRSQIETRGLHRAARMSDDVAAAEKPVRERANSPDDDTSWMSHHSGRVTGTGVEAGAGDSEAGTTMTG